MAETTYADLQIGDRVVCIDNGYSVSLKKGTEYTIRYKSNGCVYVDHSKSGWWPKRFVKLMDTKSELDKAIADAQAALDRVKSLLSQQQ